MKEAKVGTRPYTLYTAFAQSPFSSSPSMQGKGSLKVEEHNQRIAAKKGPTECKPDFAQSAAQASNSEIDTGNPITAGMQKGNVEKVVDLTAIWYRL